MAQRLNTRPVEAGAEILSEAVGAERPSAIVDVGANPIDGDPPYLGMLRDGLCTVVGFEPQPEALDALRARSGRWRPTFPTPSAIAAGT